MLKELCDLTVDLPGIILVNLSIVGGRLDSNNILVLFSHGVKFPELHTLENRHNCGDEFMNQNDIWNMVDHQATIQR